MAARSYSKDFELQADALGAEIALVAGYDPLRGTAFFDRLPDPGDKFLGSHPPNAARKAQAAATVRRPDGVLIWVNAARTGLGQHGYGWVRGPGNEDGTMIGYPEAPRAWWLTRGMARISGVNLPRAVVEGWLQRDELEDIGRPLRRLWTWSGMRTLAGRFGCGACHAGFLPEQGRDRGAGLTPPEGHVALRRQPFRSMAS
jgi:hypothetical protein